MSLPDSCLALGVAACVFSLTAAASEQTIQPGTTLTLDGATKTNLIGPLVNDGELWVREGSLAIFLGRVSGAGTFTGMGGKRFAGGLSLGNSPAVVTMEGEVEIVGNQVLMELAGATPGNGPNNHDKTIFTGPVTLSDGPDLVVLLLDGYRPQLNASFDLFDWDGGVTGTFDLVLPPDYGWDTTALYTTGEIVVTAAPVPEPETWAMLLTGLGLLGLVVQRRLR